MAQQSPSSDGLGRGRTVVIAAARDCFARFGVDKTTLDDVAKSAGMARSAIYRYFDGRQALIEAVLHERVTEIIAELRETLAHIETFPELLLEACFATIHAAGEDVEFRNLIGTHSGMALHEFLARPRGPYCYMLELIGDDLTRARKDGLVREHLNNEEIADWLGGVMMSIILRKDLDEDGERRILREFLLPSVLNRP